MIFMDVPRFQLYQADGRQCVWRCVGKQGESVDRVQSDVDEGPSSGSLLASVNHTQVAICNLKTIFGSRKNPFGFHSKPIPQRVLHITQKCFLPRTLF